MFVLCVNSSCVYVHSMCVSIFICVLSRYSLKPPSNSEVEKYIEKVFDEIFNKEIDKENILEKFSEKFESIMDEMPVANRWKSACRIVAKKVVRDHLALRRKLVGELLKTVRSISQQTFSEEAFEEGLHTLSSEPYFRDTLYKSPALKEVTVIDRENKCLVTELRSIDENEYSLDEIPIAVDSDGRCHLNVDDEKGSKTWRCDLTCKTFDNEDRQIIIDLKNEFSDDSIESVRDVLQTVDDGCDHDHYCKFSDRLVDTEEETSDESPGLIPPEEKKGHPLPCSLDCCTSRLRILRAAAVHYPVLRTLLTNIYRARRSHNGIRDIESGLSEGSISSLKNILKVQDLSELLDEEESSSTGTESLSTSESRLEVQFSEIIEAFYAKLKEDPEFTCCGCEKLLFKKVLTSFNFTTEKFKSSTWVQLKNYLRERS